MLQPKKKPELKELGEAVKDVWIDQPVNAAKKAFKNFTKDVSKKRNKELSDSAKDVFINEPLSAAKKALDNAKAFVSNKKK